MMTEINSDEGWNNSHQLLDSAHSDGIIVVVLTECHSNIDFKNSYSYRIILTNSPVVINHHQTNFDPGLSP